MLRRSLGKHLYLMRCHSTSSHSDSSNVEAGKGYKSCTGGLKYPRAGPLEMDCDLEGQSRGYDKSSLQTVPCHIAGMGALSY